MVAMVEKQSPEVFCKKGFLKNVANFTGKHLCQSLFFRASNVMKKETGTGVFLWNLQNVEEHFFTEHVWTTASDGVC